MWIRITVLFCLNEVGLTWYQNWYSLFHPSHQWASHLTGGWQAVAVIGLDAVIPPTYNLFKLDQLMTPHTICFYWLSFNHQKGDFLPSHIRLDIKQTWFKPDHCSTDFLLWKQIFHDKKGLEKSPKSLWREIESLKSNLIIQSFQRLSWVFQGFCEHESWVFKMY